MSMSRRNKLADLSSQEVLVEGRKITKAIEAEIAKVVFGDELKVLVDVLILGVFADGHIVTRAPVGLAKTLACNALAQALGGIARKRQFRPDMLPSELSGFEIYNQKTREFEVRHGPLYGTNIFLADEINRGTPKAQAALLEAMEERYLTIGSEVHHLEPVFLVLATRNPMEHEGTYTLPEAQMDRFFAQPVISNISEKTGMMVLADPDFWRSASARLERINAVTSPQEIFALREAIFAGVGVDERLDRYIWRLRDATWKHSMVAYGSSPRGAINLKKAAMVTAFRKGRDYATPEDVQRYAVDVLAHRVFMKPEYRHDPDRATSPADIIHEVLENVRYD
ncbi:MAG: AAA family ATPase [Patescibacteria group bacterium]|nr:MAG: AAA family ATPase [Patescibacteria group bacterium]